MNARRKQELLKLEAEHLENARFLNRADVVVMTESDEDERFWRAVFNHAVPNLKIMFNCDTYLSLVITKVTRHSRAGMQHKIQKLKNNGSKCDKIQIFFVSLPTK